MKNRAHLSLAILASVLALAAAEAQQPPATPTERAAPSMQGRLEDLAAFRTNFLAGDKSYSPEARAEAETRLAKLAGQAGAVSEAYFELELARIVALADNGHSHYVLGPMSNYYNRAPIRLAVFGQDDYVIRAVDPDLLGARLVAIDGHPMEALRKAGRELWGGEPAWRDRFDVSLFESPQLLHALNLAGANEAATYRFQTRTGAVIERKLAGEPPSPSRPFSTPVRAFFPVKLPLEDARWQAALSAEKAPWSLQDPDQLFRSRSAPELHALVVELRQNSDSATAKIMPALAEFTAQIQREAPTNLVIDVRLNGGGNLNTTRGFLQSLPKLVPGRIFVLTSPLTFSAGITSVGYLKQAAPERVSVVGEPVGDRMMFFAEGHGVDLPNSRGMIGMATQRHDYKDGCKTYKDCHISVVAFPIAVPTLTPDIPAPMTIEAYLAGRDPAMEAIAAALR